ncbi:MAG: hypothetical protein OCU20_08720, partial [Methanophagales archaeon]|nr:hypothetical protein [Methanophagales archaeon]
MGEMESEEILDLQFSVHWSTCSSIPGSDFLSLSDERILGSGEFVQRLLSEVDDREKETLRLSSLIRDLPSPASRIAEGEGV